MSPGTASRVTGLDAEQSEAVAVPRASGTLAIVGAAGTGKTYALVRRAFRLAAEADPNAVLLTAPSDAGVARLHGLLDARATGETVVCATFGEVALDILRGVSEHAADESIDDARASRHFESAGAELFSLEWTELVSAEIDPEITGMRTPERFSAAAYRLIRKLRASLISPEDFRAMGLRGAAAFYSRPPNLSSADLLLETPAKYRDSLRASPEELERQRLREVDLVKILARLYTSYVRTLVANGCLTATDAIYEAALLLRERPETRAPAARRFSAILIDDAQDLTLAELALVQGLAQHELANVTLAGDEEQSTRGFATGARGGESFKRAAQRIVLRVSHGAAPALALYASRVSPDTFALYRAETIREEAGYVASEVARLIASGTPPAEIAVITRNLRCAHAYIDALLGRGIRLGAQGAASLYDFPAVRDALGALWSAVDPFRHDYLLRALQSPWMRLSDASLAILCADAADPQPVLFELEGDDAAATGIRRWDRRRSLRLGRNVTRGDVDIDLPEDTRERLTAFRNARERYERAARSLEPPDLARLILDETILGTVADDARGHFTRGLVARLQKEIDTFFARETLASLEDFLVEAELVAASEDDLLELCAVPGETGVLRVLDVEAAKGETFDAAFVVDVRAGAWPRYYVPEAFLFMPSAGMIPKENVGDARAARTAKFTYASFRYKIREKYNAEERRSLYCALTRARTYLSISASGRATRGTSTPEILEELRRLCQL